MAQQHPENFKLKGPRSSQETFPGVSHRVSSNALHITCESFNQAQAQTVLGLLNNHPQCQRFFIDVQKIDLQKNNGALTFRHGLEESSIAPQLIFFKGQAGFALATNGNRVLIPKKRSEPAKSKKHVCCGRCQNCTCHHKDK